MAFEKVVNGPWLFKAKLQSRFEKMSANMAVKKDRTYILPTAFGFVFGFLSFILLMMALGYANNILYLFVFFLISFALSAMVVTNKNIDRLKMISCVSRSCFAGEESQLLVLISNPQNQPSYTVEVKCGEKILSIDEFSELQQKEVEIPWAPLKRGHNNAPRMSLRSSFPFRMLRSWKVARFENQILVFAARRGNPQFPVLNEESEKLSDQGLFRDLREFQKSDSPRRVDWRASTKHQSLLVKNFESPQEPARHFDWSQTSHLPSFEDRVSQLTLWIDRAESMGMHYTLKVGNFQTENSQGSSHHFKCLEHLALLQHGSVS